MTKNVPSRASRPTRSQRMAPARIGEPFAAALRSPLNAAPQAKLALRRLRALVLLAGAAAREVRRLARVTGEGRVHDRRGVGTGRVAAGQLGRPVRVRRVQIGQLVQHEARAEPLAQLLDDRVGGKLEVGASRLLDVGQPALAFAPLEEGVLKCVGHEASNVAPATPPAAASRRYSSSSSPAAGSSPLRLITIRSGSTVTDTGRWPAQCSA